MPADIPEAHGLTDEEAASVIEACLEGHGRRGASEAKVRACLEWANSVRSEQALLALVLEGKLAITSVRKGGFVSDELTFARRK